MLDALAKGLVRNSSKPSEVLPPMRPTVPYRASKMTVLAQNWPKMTNLDIFHRVTLDLFRALEGARASTRLLPQGQFADHHGLVCALTHVIDGESRNGTRGECFHLDPGLTGRFDNGFDRDNALAHRDVDGDRTEHQWVTERNQVACFLRGLDASDAGSSDDVALR